MVDRCAGTDLHGIELGDFVGGARQADFKALDRTEPALSLCLCDAGPGVVSDFDQARSLLWVGPERGAADAGFSELGCLGIWLIVTGG
ncbi:hypothetical protein [Streptomyces erythrochromogenes]|uniref:hypothetical protein n=1 Tax=Streptomyces erythrochromogenes TaxID=285574 RepID=UPI00386446C7|nr:hypothetical protein OG489_01480 [Streptomyces erythrochromogenes]